MKNDPSLTPAVRNALEKLGADVSLARRTRRMNREDFAARSGIAPRTVARLENGDPGVGIANLAKALLVLGSLDRLAMLLDIKSDDVALIGAEDNTPKRIRRSKVMAGSKDSASSGIGGDNGW